jgi:two-component sensor histidine kinase
MAANLAAVALDRVTAERALREESQALSREREAVAALNRALANEHDRFRHMFEQAPGFIALLRGPQHIFEFCNKSYLRLVAREDLRGQPIREALPEVAGQGYFELLDRAYATGEPYIASGAPVDLRAVGGSGLQRHYVDLIYQPVFDDSGDVLGILVEGHDVTERALAADHRQLLINELNHRVKNTLATVQSLAHQTLRDARTLQDAKVTLTSRLISLSRTHDVLTRENWAGAEIGEIIDEAMTAHVGPAQKRILANGPKLMLGPRAALALSMALHELGTNALKYGALSNDGGVVSIGWSESDCGHAHLEWCERGGPPIEAPPAQKGFGSRLLQSGLAVELGAAARVEFARDGLVCSMRVPLAEPSPATLLERV